MLGIEAPQDIPVHRMEVYQAIKRNEAEVQAKEDNVPKEE